MISDTAEDTGESNLCAGSVELRGLDQRVGDGCGLAPAFRAGEEPVLASDGHPTDRPLSSIVVDLQPAVGEATSAGHRLAGAWRARTLASGAALAWPAHRGAKTGNPVIRREFSSLCQPD